MTAHEKMLWQAFKIAELTAILREDEPREYSPDALEMIAAFNRAFMVVDGKFVPRSGVAVERIAQAEE